MRKLILLATVASVALLGLVVLAPLAFAGSGTEQDPFGPGDKVPFCHYDGSDNGGGGSGKYNMPNASTTATGPAGHQEQHEFDVIPSYWFAQHEDEDPVFFPGRNWPTLNHLPTSPIDFSSLLGSSASAFIAGGCAAPPCPDGTQTTTVTNTAPPVTVTETKTVTVSAAALKNEGGENDVVTSTVAPPEECVVTKTETVTPTITVTKTITETETTSPPSTTTPPASTTPPATTATTTATTATETTSTATTPPPTTTSPPPNQGPGNPPNKPPNNPPKNLPPQPTGTAFTGPEGITGWLQAHKALAIASVIALLAFGLLMTMRGFALGKDDD